MAKINSVEPQTNLMKTIDYSDVRQKDSPGIYLAKQDQTLQSLKLFGIQMSGLDLKQIDQAHLVMHIPLLAGKKYLMGLQKDARLNIKENTEATLKLDLMRNEKRQLCLQGFSLNFNQSIKIKNPVSSLTEGRIGSRGAKIIDKFFDVKINSIYINKLGSFSIDGSINAFKILNAHLPEKRMAINPVLDESLLVGLGLFPSADTKSAGEGKHRGEPFKLKKLLKQLGHMTNIVPYSLSVFGERSDLSFSKGGMNMHGPKSPLMLKMSGTVDLEDDGDVVIVADKNAQAFSLGNYVVGGQLKLSHLGEEGPIKLNLEADISGSAKGLVIDGFSNGNMKKVFPRQGHRLSKNESGDKKRAYEIGADNFFVNAKLKVDASLKAGNNDIKGSLSGQIVAENPYAKIENRGVKLSGQISGDLKLNKLSYSEEGCLQGTRASFTLGMKPDQATLNAYPTLKPIDLKYRLKINSDQKAIIKPPKYGAARFIKSIQNFEGDRQKVDTKGTKESICSIGSEGYFHQMEKITGAKLRGATELKLLFDGLSSMPERLSMINRAQKYLCFQTFEFKDDQSGWAFAHALADAQARGVKVFGIIDGLGNVKSLKMLEQDNPIYEFLIKNGISLKIYNNAFEEGLRTIFSVTKRYPAVFPMVEKSLHNIAGLLDYFQKVVAMIDDPQSELTRQDQNILANAIHRLFGGSKESLAHISVDELRQILEHPLIDLKELLLALKRLGNISYRSHEKYLIVDGEEAIVGGMNIADEYLRGGMDEMVSLNGKYQPAFRDTDVKLAGEVVHDAYRSFRRNWLLLAQERLPFIKSENKGEDSYRVSMLQSRPWEDGDIKIVNFWLYNLRTLKGGEKAWFETAYFLPRGVLRVLQKELVQAAKRGVDVRILTNSKETTDFKPLVEAAIFDYRELMGAGVRIFERNNDRMVHAKVAVLGDGLTAIGSWNMDNRSAVHDSEDLCVVYDKTINQEMSKQLSIDMFDQSNEVRWADIKALPLGAEAKAAAMLLLGELI